MATLLPDLTGVVISGRDAQGDGPCPSPYRVNQARVARIELLDKGDHRFINDCSDGGGRVKFSLLLGLNLLVPWGPR